MFFPVGKRMFWMKLRPILTVHWAGQLYVPESVDYKLILFSIQY